MAKKSSLDELFKTARVPQWEPPAELRKELDEFLVKNYQLPAHQRVGAPRLTGWFAERGVAIGVTSVSRWMRRREHELGLGA